MPEKKKKKKAKRKHAPQQGLMNRNQRKMLLELETPVGKIGIEKPETGLDYIRRGLFKKPKKGERY